jgi:hypothetical protein
VEVVEVGDFGCSVAVGGGVAVVDVDLQPAFFALAERNTQGTGKFLLLLEMSTVLPLLQRKLPRL